MGIRFLVFASALAQLGTVCTADAALVGHWKLDESGPIAYGLGGTPVLDSSNYGNVGKYFNYGADVEVALPSAHPRLGTSVDFNGTNELFIQSPEIINSFNDRFTVAGWMKTTQNSGAMRMFSSHIHYSTEGWGFGLNNGSLLFTGYGVVDVNFAKYVANGEWNHIAATVDSAAGGITFFLNGNKLGTVAMAAPNPTGASTRNWFISGLGTAQRFDGLLDDVRVYDAVLPHAGIEQLALRYGTPIFRYTFPGAGNLTGAGQTIVDGSSAGNNARTLYGGTGFHGADPFDPAGANAADGSLNAAVQSIVTTGTQLLRNESVAEAGGFVMEAAFRLDASYASRRIMDYAGTDSIGTHTSGGLDYFQVRMNNETLLDYQISKGQWYDSRVEFLADSETLTPDLDHAGQFKLDGTLNVYLDDVLIYSEFVTRTGLGDSWDGPIGIGKDAVASAGWFQGLIYNPTVHLVPEPTTLSMLSFGLLAVFGAGRRRRRKAYRAGVCP